MKRLDKLTQELKVKRQGEIIERYKVGLITHAEAIKLLGWKPCNRIIL